MKGSNLDHIHLPTPLKCSTTIVLSLSLAFFSQKSLSHLPYCTLWKREQKSRTPLSCTAAAQQRRLQVSPQQLGDAEGWKALASLNKSISWPLNYASSTLKGASNWYFLSQRTKEMKGKGVPVKTDAHSLIKTGSSFKEAHLETIKPGTIFCSSLPRTSSIFSHMSSIWWVTANNVSSQLAFLIALIHMS